MQIKSRIHDKVLYVLLCGELDEHSASYTRITLDDIFDKLDKTRISALLQMVGQEHFGQVFITDTDEVRVSQILGEHGIQHKIIEMGCILNS